MWMPPTHDSTVHQIQLWKMNMAPLLNKPYVNEVTLNEQNLTLLRRGQGYDTPAHHTNANHIF